MRAFLGLLATVLIALPISSGPQEPEKKPIERATGYKPPTPEQRQAAYGLNRVRHGGRVAMAAKAMTAPEKFDCVDMGWVPPIVDQGNCGSCYLVATCDQASCTWIKAGYGKNDGSFKISDQFGMDTGCGHPNFGGCNGGWGAEVAEWMTQGGFPAERWIDEKGQKQNDYPPYEARTRQCREKPGAKRWKPASWGFCSGSSGRRATVDEIKASLMQYGVVNIAFNANSAYSGAGTNVVRVKGGANHETTLVGWDDSKKAWKTRGNWGTGLGDKGYVWMTWDSDLDDPFWMTANPLPPPPPPPDPPDPPLPPGPPVPGPLGGITFTFPRDLPAGSYSYQLVPHGSEVVPAGTLHKLREVTDRVKELQDLLNRKDDPEKKEEDKSGSKLPGEPEENKVELQENVGQSPEPPVIRKKFDPYNQKPVSPRSGRSVRQVRYEPDTSARWNPETGKYEP